MLLMTNKYTIIYLNISCISVLLFPTFSIGQQQIGSLKKKSKFHKHYDFEFTLFLNESTRKIYEPNSITQLYSLALSNTQK